MCSRLVGSKLIAPTGEPAIDDVSEPEPESIRVPCRDVPVKMMMLTSWIVLLTVVVNGSSMSKLISVLGLDELSNDRKFMLDRAMKKLAAETRFFMASLRESHKDEEVDWNRLVIAKCSLKNVGQKIDSNDTMHFGMNRSSEAGSALQIEVGIR